MAVSNRFDGRHVYNGWHGLDLADLLHLSRLILSSEIYDAGLRLRLCGTVETVANTSRLPNLDEWRNGHDELHCNDITELLPLLPRFLNHRVITQSCRVPARSTGGLRSRSNTDWHSCHGQGISARQPCQVYHARHSNKSAGSGLSEHLARVILQRDRTEPWCLTRR